MSRYDVETTETRALTSLINQTINSGLVPNNQRCLSAKGGMSSCWAGQEASLFFQKNSILLKMQKDLETQYIAMAGRINECARSMEEIKSTSATFIH